MSGPSLLRANATAIRGALELGQNGLLTGWCWCAERRSEPLCVEILQGNTVLASLIASTFRRDLAEAGLDDGRHGFTLQLPPHTGSESGRLIQARERSSGTIFASVFETRITPGSDPGQRSASERLDRATAELGGLQAQLAALQAKAAHARTQSRPARALADMAALLTARLALQSETANTEPRFAAAAAGASLRAQFGSVTLPKPAQTRPAVSVILLAAPQIGMTMAALRALSHVPDHADIECLLADDGTDPYTALIHTVVQNIRLASARDGAGAPPSQTAPGPAPAPARSQAIAMVDAVSEACALARGTHLVVLQASAPISATALARLLSLLQAHPGLMIPGSAGRRSLARWGLAAPDSPHRPTNPQSADQQSADPQSEELTLALRGSIGLVAALSAELFTQAGGLDPLMADGMGLEWADLALKSWLLGASIARVMEEVAGLDPQPELPPALPAEAWQAAARFRARWGDLGLEQHAS